MGDDKSCPGCADDARVKDGGKLTLDGARDAGGGGLSQVLAPAGSDGAGWARIPGGDRLAGEMASMPLTGRAQQIDTGYSTSAGVLLPDRDPAGGLIYQDARGGPCPDGTDLRADGSCGIFDRRRGVWTLILDPAWIDGVRPATPGEARDPPPKPPDPPGQTMPPFPPGSTLGGNRTSAEPNRRLPPIDRPDRPDCYYKFALVSTAVYMKDGRPCRTCKLYRTLVCPGANEVEAFVHEFEICEGQSSYSFSEGLYSYACDVWFDSMTVTATPRFSMSNRESDGLDDDPEASTTELGI